MQLISQRDVNPRSPCGERHVRMWIPAFGAIFQSTLPMRGATSVQAQACRSCLISIHAPHAGSDPLMKTRSGAWCWNFIHAPHAGSDRADQLCSRIGNLISIHAPHAGSDVFVPCASSSAALFQSTLPMRGATLCLILRLALGRFQSTLPMRGATAYLFHAALSP